MQAYVAGFLFDASETFVALVRKNKPEWQKGLLNAIGGKIENMEAPIDAMHREFHEETGMKDLDWTLFAVVRNVQQQWVVNFFRANTNSDCHVLGVKSVEEEKIEIHITDDVWRRNVPTISNLRWLVPMAMLSSRHDWPYVIEEKANVNQG